MSRGNEGRGRQNKPEGTDEFEGSVRRPKIDPDERDEYEEWRRERGRRGRKKKDKMGGRHRRREVDDY